MKVGNGIGTESGDGGVDVDGVIPMHRPRPYRGAVCGGSRSGDGTERTKI